MPCPHTHTCQSQSNVSNGTEFSMWLVGYVESMGRNTAVVSLLLLISPVIHTRLSSQACPLRCIIQGDETCPYCRITKDDVETTLGVKTAQMFGSCVPLPCPTLLSPALGPALCLHYVHAPQNINVEFTADHNPAYDTVVVTWQPSPYGIAFLRGFLVSLQALGGYVLDCQLFLFQHNVSLSAAHTRTVYQSDPFTRLPLSSQFAVTVMALPVPEMWESFYKTVHFSTRSCPEKNGLQACRHDWFPEFVQVQQEEHAVLVTFNLAPSHLGISSYFSWCYSGGTRNYTAIPVEGQSNSTFHSFRLLGLRAGANYTCQIAADVVDARRKNFSFTVAHTEHAENTQRRAVTFLLLPTCAMLLVGVAALMILLTRNQKKSRQRRNTEACDSKFTPEDQSQVLIDRRRPPGLLMCYSCADDPHHEQVILQLAAFLQQHMAVQVYLDLWEYLSVMEEGHLSWYCRRMHDSDFVMVVCSRGLRQQLYGRSWLRSGVEPVTVSPGDVGVCAGEGGKCPGDVGVCAGEGGKCPGEGVVCAGEGGKCPGEVGVCPGEGGKCPGEGGVCAGEGGKCPGVGPHLAAIHMYGEELGRARARGEDLSRYLTVGFEAWGEEQVPPLLSLAAHYTLLKDLPLLFSHLHQVELQRPGHNLQVELGHEESLFALHTAIGGPI